MKRSLFLRLFPTPDYLAPRPVGVDLSDRSLKYCRLSGGNGLPKLTAYGELPVPLGAIEGGRIKNAAAVIEVLKVAAKNFGTKYVAASLPEEPGFTFLTVLPAASRANLREAIELQLEEHIPLPASGVVFDYAVLREPTAADSQFQIVVSAFPQDLALEYVSIFTAADLIPVAFEGETQATVRALFPPTAAGAALVIDLGKTHTSFFVAVEKWSVLTSTVAEIGGDFLTRAVEKGLGIKFEEAEELKNKRGLLQGQDRSLVELLLPAVSVLRDEAARFLSYWNLQPGHGGLPSVSRLVLSGGQAFLPGLAEYLSASLGLPTEVGNVWQNLLPAASVVPPLPLQQSLRQAVTLGLVLRSRLRI